MRDWILALNSLLRRIPVPLVWALGLAPGVWSVWLLLSGGLGPDPIKPLEHALGKYALQFLIASLCVTPLMRLTGVTLMRFRRALGLLAFTYAVAHLSVWLLLDIQLRWSEIGNDILRRPYITIGMAAFALLIPLAVTSRDSVMRRMGPRLWRRLHLLVYPAAILGVIHYIMVFKTWMPQPLVYASIAGLLVIMAVVRRVRQRQAR